MIKQKMYEVIRSMLQDNKRLRNNDKELIWSVWVYELGHADKGYITRNDFMELSSTETIRRTRQKVQEDYTDLRSDDCVQQAKKQKAYYKGNLVYQEPITWGMFERS